MHEVSVQPTRPATAATPPPEPEMMITARDVCRRLTGPNGDITEIVDGVSLTVRAGETVAVVGPSGCGKTFFLNMVAGLEPVTSGQLEVRGGPPNASKQGIGYAFARDALLPWRTAQQNVELALKLKRFPKRNRSTLALEALRAVGLADFAGAYPSQLSQGMRQRAALARTIAPQPELILLDEPFAALDAQTRVLMTQLLLDVLSERPNVTVLLVTHDLGEAITVADRVILFTRRPARVKQEFEIRIPRPRAALALRSDEAFEELERTIWAALADEVPQLGEHQDRRGPSPTEMGPA